jgi:hypothetical protein
MVRFDTSMRAPPGGTYLGLEAVVLAIVVIDENYLTLPPLGERPTLEVVER